MASKLTLKRRYQWVVNYGIKRHNKVSRRYFDNPLDAKNFMAEWVAQSSKYGPTYWATDSIVVHSK